MSTQSLASGRHTGTGHTSLQRTMMVIETVIAAFRDGHRARAAYHSAVSRGETPAIAAASSVLLGRKRG
ncbi:MAG: hypothetical protein SFW09_18410 [Hyphomicrobiaceae bacterium]|nr:hypothetical protein [Hyphomicrobiaceae bacterium]